ncbi:TetR family transcriptional regulator [Bradyrhizobium sp. CSA207]|uniref:TetR/AcrR family transcriptional regulator n=1 Tax=Bradyrhizobium sp. CSA207 TaxID=2698826 RepID=UPI0023B07E5E|nr:TetR/AcrR family transcriptional regulator [Bradyrhizobium sp. CSA207]MDE5445799.1 TetR family transcriptional regulator [Bradyrhizobium sp. CSA207]
MKKRAIEDGGRERVCQAAMRLYAEGGLEAVTMRTIGNELGVSSMMPYRHFTSKDEIFVEIRARVFENFANYLERAVCGGTTPLQRFVTYFYAYAGFARDASRDYRFIFDRWPKAQYDIVLEREGKEAFSKTRSFDLQLQVTADLLDKPVESRQVLESAHIIWQCLHGLVALHIAKKHGFGLTIEDLLRPTIISLLKGLFPEQELTTLRRPALAAAVGLISSNGGDEEKKLGRRRRSKPKQDK